MNILGNLLIISWIIVYIVDLSGFREDCQRLIWRWLYPNVTYKEDWVLKPFFCSTCLVFWFGLLYICITGFTWYLAGYICLLSFLTPVIKDLGILIRDLVTKIIDLVYKIWK